MDFSGNHILSIDQFDRSDIEKLFSVADKLEAFASKEKLKPLNSKGGGSSKLCV